MRVAVPLRLALALLLTLAGAAPLEGQRRPPPAAPRGAPVAPRSVQREASGRGNELVVIATDSAFAAPSQVDAGLVHIRLVNRGREPHHVLVMKVNRLARLAEIEEMLRSNDFSPSWIESLGGPESVISGATSSASMVLEPGRYVIACVVASPATHRRRYMDGMIAELAVVSPGRSWLRTPLPRAEITLRLSEWNFELSTPIRPGRRTIRIDNLGTREHQVAFVRLLPRRTVVEALRWVESPAGPPPFEVAGGTTGLSPKQSVNVEVDFIPGEYLLLCNLYDGLGRKAHLQMGMVKRIVVSE